MAKATLRKAARKSDGKPREQVSRRRGEGPRAAKPMALKVHAAAAKPAPAKSVEGAPPAKVTAPARAPGPEIAARVAPRPPKAAVEQSQLPEIPPPLPAPIASFTF
jgi:hypothetical protein